jgi:hypothetical protein
MPTAATKFVMDSGAGKCGTSDMSLLSNVQPCKDITISGAFGPSTVPTHAEPALIKWEAEKGSLKDAAAVEKSDKDGRRKAAAEAKRLAQSLLREQENKCFCSS